MRLGPWPATDEDDGLPRRDEDRAWCRCVVTSSEGLLAPSFQKALINSLFYYVLSYWRCRLLTIPSSGRDVTGHRGLSNQGPAAESSTQSPPLTVLSRLFPRTGSPCLYYVMVPCLALIGRSPPPTLPYRLYTRSLYAIMLRVQPGWLEIGRKSLRAWH